MQISDERIDDFISRWEQVFGGRLTREVARPIAARLVQFYRLILQPFPESGAPQDKPLDQDADASLGLDLSVRN